MACKNDLEKGEEILRKFHHESGEVENFLSTTEQEMHTWEAGEPQGWSMRIEAS